MERSPGGAQPHGAAGGGEAAGGVGLVEWVSHVSGDIGQLATPSERHSDWMTSWRWQQPCSHGWLMTKPGIRVSVVKAGSGSQAAAASSSFEVVGPCGCRGAGGWITRKGRQLWQAHQPAFRLDGQLTVSAHWPTARWDDQLTASAHRPTARRPTSSQPGYQRLQRRFGCPLRYGSLPDSPHANASQAVYWGREEKCMNTLGVGDHSP